jgi:hypothetical protein
MPSETSTPILPPRNSQHMASTIITPYRALVCMTFIASRVGIVWSSARVIFRPLAASSGVFLGDEAAQAVDEFERVAPASC